MRSAAAEEAIWRTEGERKRSAVQRMFSEIAPRYDLLNSLLSLRLHHRWRAAAVAKLGLKIGGSALDVCCGTGDFLPLLRRAVGAKGTVAGLDFCLPMLEVAREKLSGGVPLLLADACAIPVRSGSFEGVTVGWGIRNVPDVDQAHREIVRVLEPGGRFVSLDMARPRNPLVRVLSTLMFRTLVPRLGSLFGSKKAYTYLPESTQLFMDRKELAESMQRAGFRDVGFRDFMMGNICMHWGTKA